MYGVLTFRYLSRQNISIQNYILVNISFRKAVSNSPHMEKLDNYPAHEKMLFVGLSLS